MKFEEKLKKYLDEALVLEFINANECMDFFNKFNGKEYRCVKDMKKDIGNRQFCYKGHYFHINEDCAMDIKRENVSTMIDMYTRSEWFGNDIYISPNENIYCLYPFCGGTRTLIMDEDMTFDEYKKIIEGIEEYKEASEVMVYWMYSEMDTNEEIQEVVRKIVAEYEENPQNFLEKYNSKNRKEVLNMNKNKELREVPPEEFITKWEEMKKYWINNDGDNDENSYYNRIINQSINIELPLLGIKTELFWCPPTVEGLDDIFGRMIDDSYFNLLVKEKRCYYTGGGIWLAEVPFEYDNRNLVMVVDNEFPEVWSVYENVLEENGIYDSVEYDELLVNTGNVNENMFIDWEIYYYEALRLLAGREG